MKSERSVEPVHQSQYQKLQDMGIEIPMSTVSQKTFDPKQFDRLCEEIRDRNICVLAHYYASEVLQELAEKTGGIVSDSLQMATFGAKSNADTLIICGVRFMGETAKILTSDKQVLMPNLRAECSLDLACPADQFKAFCEDNPGHTVVVYANTSAEVKALSDWVVTSSIAKEVVSHLHARGERVIWAPDRYLGQYIQRETDAQMLIWDGACVVHESFKAKSIDQLKDKYPDAAVIAHPESPSFILDKADSIGSTSHLIKATQQMSNDVFIVATDPGILHQMKKTSPNKLFLTVPTEGHSATCQSCNYCPWMAMNTLEGVEECLRNPSYHQVNVELSLAKRAAVPIKKMLRFAADLNLKSAGDA